MAAKNRCTGCKSYYPKESLIVVTAGKFHSQECLREYGMNNANKVIASAKLKDKKDHALRKRVFYGSDLKTRKAAAQVAFNAFIRARDKDKHCVSCNKNHTGQYHAGHLKTVGARGDVRFNEDNCHKQCSVCNNHLSGNVAEYRANLIKLLGEKRVLALDVVDKTYKPTAKYYKEIEKTYKAKLKLIS